MSIQPEFEFQQLNHFLAVAEQRNFSRAAEKVGLSQSALSRSIQRLEQQVGQPLFERQPRDVVLTELGELLLGRAQQIMALVEDTFAELSESNKTGRIRLATIPTIAPYFLPCLLREFADQHPQVSVVVQEDTTDEILRLCNHGEVDLALLALPLEARYLEIEPLFEEELLLVLPNGHQLANKRSIKLDDVRELPFVMLGEAHCLTDNISSFCQRESVEPVAVERTSQLATVQELVTLGHGISMVPKMAESIDRSDRRVYRSFSGEKPMRTIAMVNNPYRYRSEWVETFMAFIRDYTAR